MKNKSLFLLALLSANGWSQNHQVRNPDVRNQDDRSQATIRREEQQDIDRAFFQQEKLSEAQAPISGRLNDAALQQNPQQLEGLIVQALQTLDKEKLPRLLKLYQQVPSRDESLIEWGNAILLTDRDMGAAVAAYRKLISSFPDNDLIRFQLASVLFYNQEYEASKGQFEKLRASSKITSNDQKLINQYIEAINNKDRWNFSFSGTFLHDPNLGNAAKQGTRMTLPNGSSLTMSSPRQEGTGVGLGVGANKQWSFGGGKYLSLESSLNHKYYWNNKKFNDLNLYAGVGLGYNNPIYSVEVMPYVSKRLYSGGTNGNSKMRSYTNNFGASLSANAWLNPKWKYSFYYDLNYIRYTQAAYARQYDGLTQSVSNSLMYFPNPKQYWSVGVDYSHSGAKQKPNAYDRIGGRIGWGQEWPMGFATRASLGYGERAYKAVDYHGLKETKKEFNSSLSVWHKAIHYRGFTPRLTLSYQKTDSNVPISRYDKFQGYVEVNKNF